jgi:hypothetical protein
MTFFSAFMLWVLCGAVGFYFMLKADQERPSEKRSWVRGKLKPTIVFNTIVGGFILLLVGIFALSEQANPNPEKK